MKQSKNFGLSIVVIVLVLVFMSLFTVREGQKALVLQLGKIATDNNGQARIYEPGIHFKFPIINSLRNFDTRINGFSSVSFSALTSKQTFLEVEYFVRWRIKDLALFYKRTGGIASRAERLMEPKINDIVRAEFGKRTSNEIISSERDKIMQAILDQAKSKVLTDYGIEIVDVRLQAIKLPERVLKSVFNRMASERKQFANNKRAEGMKVAESVNAKADQQVIVIKATATKNAALIKAKGEQEAAKIYADAYSRDRDFFEFYRSLQAYQQSFDANSDVLVLAPDSDFFKYFNQSHGKVAN